MVQTQEKLTTLQSMKRNLLSHKKETAEQEERLDEHEKKVFKCKSELSHFKMESEEQVRTDYSELNKLKQTLA